MNKTLDTAAVCSVIFAIVSGFFAAATAPATEEPHIALSILHRNTNLEVSKLVLNKPETPQCLYRSGVSKNILVREADGWRIFDLGRSLLPYVSVAGQTNFLMVPAAVPSFAAAACDAIDPVKKVTIEDAFADNKVAFEAIAANLEYQKFVQGIGSNGQVWPLEMK